MLLNNRIVVFTILISVFHAGSSSPVKTRCFKVNRLAEERNDEISQDLVNDLVKSKITRICYEEEVSTADVSNGDSSSLEEDGDDQMRKLLKGMLMGNLKTKAAGLRRLAKANAAADESRDRHIENDESDVDARAFNGADSEDNGFNKRIKTMKRLKGRPQMPFRIGKRSL